jgi:hypothetical protein
MNTNQYIGYKESQQSWQLSAQGLHLLPLLRMQDLHAFQVHIVCELQVCRC